MMCDNMEMALAGEPTPRSNSSSAILGLLTLLSCPVGIALELSFPRYV